MRLVPGAPRSPGRGRGCGRRNRSWGRPLAGLTAQPVNDLSHLDSPGHPCPGGDWPGPPVWKRSLGPADIWLQGPQEAESVQPQGLSQAPLPWAGGRLTAACKLLLGQGTAVGSCFPATLPSCTGWVEGPWETPGLGVSLACVLQGNARERAAGEAAAVAPGQLRAPEVLPAGVHVPSGGPGALPGPGAPAQGDDGEAQSRPEGQRQGLRPSPQAEQW